jgi:hypothetical protein
MICLTSLTFELKAMIMFRKIRIMKKIKWTLAATSAFLGLATLSYAQQPYLNEVAFTSAGTTSDFQQPIGTISGVAGVNASGLNISSGLGTITYTSTALGSQYFGLFMDIDNDLKNSTAFEDEGSGIGTPFAGESWEVGDAQRTALNNIFNDAAANSLPNANTVNAAGYSPPVSPPYGDVSFALGINFKNTVPGTETITITSSLTAPASGFYLEQENIQDVADGDDQPNYLSATARFTPSTKTVPDDGSTLSALALGVMALTGLKNRFMRK